MLTREAHAGNLVQVTQCYYCNGSALSPAFRGVTDRIGASVDTWQFLKCPTCESLILSPRPENSVLASFYPDDYSPVAPHSRHAPLYAVKSFVEYWLVYRWIHRGQAKAALRALGRRDGEGLQLLDIGFGNGFFLKEAAALKFAVTGCDQRASAVTYAKEVLGLPAICASTHDITQHFAPGTFDVISAFHVVEHLPAPLQAVQQWATLLKPGGMLVVGVPVIDCLQASLFGRRWCAIREAPRHVSVPSRQGMKMLLERAGFRQVQIHGDSLLLNASAAASTLVPGCLQASTPKTPTSAARLAYMANRLLGLFLAYASLPLALAESWMARSGQCVITAPKE